MRGRKSRGASTAWKAERTAGGERAPRPGIRDFVADALEVVRQTAGLRLTLVLVIVMAGCAARPAGHEQVLSRAAGAGSAPGDLMSARDQARLAALAAERERSTDDGGYRIGPEDLLEIRVPDLVDTRTPVTAARAGDGTLPSVAGAPVFQQGVRVSARGDITVPALGLVHAEGLTPTELEADIASRLVAAGILRAPQVSVQIAEHRSRVIAVLGSVERPGLYPATRPGATIAELVWAAGGPSKDAGRVVQFVPARAASDPDAAPIRLDLEVLLHAPGRDTGSANPPAHPGDVISIAPAGSVLVSGWVEKPGSYPVTRGLTVGGAVAAAGGHLFPADTHRATVKRVVAPGEQRSFTVDLAAVQEGREPDVPLADGDLVRVPAAAARLVPWGVWTLAREMVHIGGSVLLF